MKNKRLIQKSIRFPAVALQVVEEEIQRTLGITVNEYLKSLIVSKAEEITNKNIYEQEPSPKLQLLIAEAKQEIKEGKRKPLKTDKDIEEYFEALFKEEDE